MKPDYKNWFPKGMVYGFFAGTSICLALFFVVLSVDFIPMKSFQTMLVLVFGVFSVIMIVISIWGFKMHQAFSYDGKRQMSRQIIEGIASYIIIPAGGKGLDVGCGSGALAIAVAKKNPDAMIVGIDRWGKEYASFSKTLCKNNARAESVTNTSFFPGDAVNLLFLAITCITTFLVAIVKKSY